MKSDLSLDRSTTEDDINQFLTVNIVNHIEVLLTSKVNTYSIIISINGTPFTGMMIICPIKYHEYLYQADFIMHNDMYVNRSQSEEPVYTTYIHTDEPETFVDETTLLIKMVTRYIGTFCMGLLDNTPGYRDNYSITIQEQSLENDNKQKSNTDNFKVLKEGTFKANKQGWLDFIKYCWENNLRIKSKVQYTLTLDEDTKLIYTSMVTNCKIIEEDALAITCEYPTIGATNTDYRAFSDIEEAICVLEQMFIKWNEAIAKVKCKGDILERKFYITDLGGNYNV